MANLTVGRIVPGDTLVCCHCDHERRVDQIWIDAVCERHFFSRHPPRLHDSDLWRFRCSSCNSKALLKRPQLPARSAQQRPFNGSRLASVTEHHSKYQIATAYIEQASEAERAALYSWASQLLVLRSQDLSAIDKATRAVRLTIESGTILPFVKFLGAEIKRVGWDERELPGRLALTSAAAAALVFGGQGAGIAALGGAIGVPLWVVFGAGGAFAGVIVNETKRRGTLPPTQSSKPDSER